MTLSSCQGAIGLSRKCWKVREEKTDPTIAEWKPQIERILEVTPCYGYRKVTKTLQRQGIDVNHKRVMRIMNVTGLKQKKRMFKPRTTDSRHKLRTFPNLIATVSPLYPFHILVSDITYVTLPSGFCYVAIVLDIFTKKVVGWAIALHMEKSLVIEALEMALRKGTPTFHHSDRGSQYCSLEYVALLESKGVQVSMAATGVSVDNPFAESFNKTLKVEEVYLKDYRNMLEAKESIGSFIEEVYHAKRIHQALEYVTPNEFEERWKTMSLRMVASSVV
jgi:putative transposase